jgi:hypothetical protein
MHTVSRLPGMDAAYHGGGAFISDELSIPQVFLTVLMFPTEIVLTVLIFLAGIVLAVLTFLTAGRRRRGGREHCERKKPLVLEPTGHVQRRSAARQGRA